MVQFGDYQNEIYAAGLRGVLPKLPVDAATLEARAEAAMPPHVLNYVQGGCGDEATQRRNSTAFADWGMVPRMRSEEHTSELQSLMRISYAVFCLKKKKNEQIQQDNI